jgi:hypothetical protein
VDFLNAAEHCTVPSIQPTGRIPRRHGRKARSIATCCSKRRSGVGKVIQALVYLNGKYPQRKGIRAGAGPFPSSLPAHDPLPTLRARHEPIGSGVTEAACKTHVGQGRKRSRMPGDMPVAKPSWPCVHCHKASVFITAGPCSRPPTGRRSVSGKRHGFPTATGRLNHQLGSYTPPMSSGDKDFCFAHSTAWQ